ncbi:DUF2380 domain-containing protein [Archangium primigenium]|uniref:DUF2380 domain-containing protein n=1 Tax=[Archangium] primigenium TaxID=2792470 RepID=UPI00195EEF4E|nr:DUF2380 domain-containing protein [Archangium primigenium]MBM7112549.1 DUF2380 domain-containing protein [Archangium primigenium]
MSPRGQGAAARPEALATQLAFLRASREVSDTTRRLKGDLARLQAPGSAFSRHPSDLFRAHLPPVLAHLRWLDAEHAAAVHLSDTASQLADPDMRLALLRMGGPRLEAAWMGSTLLAIWLDFPHLAEVVLRECPAYGTERLLRKLHPWHTLMAPALKALASGETGRVEAVAVDLPALTGYLSREFAATREAVRTAAQRTETALRVKEIVELLTTASAMTWALPRLPPSAPLTLGLTLGAGAPGVMLGSQVVLTAEGVEMLRRLVQAGVLSPSVVSAAVRIQAGQVLMAQAHDELPRGVREALGEGPEVRGMRVTGRAGAGLSEAPRHHVLPREFREWFEQRGFTGELSIDRFCVRMERARHEAIHGGGSWRLGREWPGEWNRMIMTALRRAERRTGRQLTRNEVLDLVAEAMKQYNLPMNFTSWNGR